MSLQDAGDLAERFAIPTTVVRFEPAQTVYPFGNRVWIGQITSGVVRIYSINEAGISITHRNHGAGSLIGIGALIGDGDRVAAQSVGLTFVRRFESERVRLLWRTNVAFCHAIAANLFEGLMETYDHHVLNLRGSQIRRLAIELLDRAEGTHDGPLTVRASHEDLANSIGSSREVVTRQLKAMASLRLVGQSHRREIMVIDLEHLMTLALRGRSIR